MKDALSARVVAHYFGAADALPTSARAVIEAAGIRILPAADRTALSKLVSAIPADALLISSALLPNPSRTLSVLRRLYGRKGLALIVLIRDDDGLSEAAAIAAGADDALKAPADASLLAARIDATLRTVEQYSAPTAWPKSVLRTRDAEIALDLRAQRCLVREKGGYREVLLTRKQITALAALLRAQGRPVSWENLFRRGWRPGKLRRRSRTLVQHVIALRRKLGRAGLRIAAVPGTGYRLNS